MNRIMSQTVDSFHETRLGMLTPPPGPTQLFISCHSQTINQSPSLVGHVTSSAHNTAVLSSVAATHTRRVVYAGGNNLQEVAGVQAVHKMLYKEVLVLLHIIRAYLISS